MNAVPSVVVSGGFDNPRSSDLRFLQEAARGGKLTLLLWSDETVARVTGQNPRFPLAERQYFLESVRFVSQVAPIDSVPGPESLAERNGLKPDIWVDHSASANEARRAACQRLGLEYRVLSPDDLRGFPDPCPPPGSSGRKKVVVTGCYDWFHSGHVRFFEEVSAHGDLYVIVGHDANIRMLKGAGHPLLPQDERRYLAACIRHVTQALISSGDGWLDADPEIQRLRPDIYAVNEDGDKGGKRDYCRQRGLEYLVLQRLPAPGLPRRTSTDLRGF